MKGIKKISDTICNRISREQCRCYMNLAECWSSVMQVDVREMCAASMSQDGLETRSAVFSADFVIWMRSLEETTDWLQNLQMGRKAGCDICSSDRDSGPRSDRDGLPGAGTDMF